MSEVLTLRGCAPEPLSNYLKALGVLRLLAEPNYCNKDKKLKAIDPQAKGYWHNDAFVLVTHLTPAELETSHYYHYGDAPAPKKSTAPNWNQQQQAAARTRITQAIADLLNQNNLPSGITTRRNAIVQYGISQSTLTKHKDLWHPQFLTEPPALPSAEALHPDVADSALLQQAQAAPAGLLQPATTNKLVASADVDAPQPASAGNRLTEVGGCGGISTGGSVVGVAFPMLPEHQNYVSADTKATLAALKLAKAKVRASAYAARMQRYLESGDPILLAEAQQWLMALRSKAALLER